jgi:hypothetical protein
MTTPLSGFGKENIIKHGIHTKFPEKLQPKRKFKPHILEDRVNISDFQKFPGIKPFPGKGIFPEKPGFKLPPGFVLPERPRFVPPGDVRAVYGVFPGDPGPGKLQPVYGFFPPGPGPGTAQPVYGFFPPKPPGDMRLVYGVFP